MADTPIGLTTDEAHRRLAKDGPNAIVDPTQHPVFRRAKNCNSLQTIAATTAWHFDESIASANRICRAQ